MDILYEDEFLLVCRKPAGVATQTRKLGQQDMESLLRNHRAKKGETPYIGMVHRLDQPVAGIMVWGKTPEATAKLAKQVQERSIGKRYYAIVSKGQSLQAEETLEDEILFDKKTNCSKVVAKGTKDAKHAALFYRILKENQSYALVDVELQTGRHHQIRVQFASRGCPLLGDTKYGNGPYEEGLCLYSYGLSFIHPTTRKKLVFSDEVTWRILDIY